MAPFLAYEMENRGRNSWGATNGIEVVKKLGGILRTFELPEQWEQAIYHTRLASCGAVTIPNQHPFEFFKEDGTRVLGIHNGGVSNHESLNSRYQRDFSVDSMHIYAHIASGLPTTEIQGYGALAWYEQKPSEVPVLHLAKFNMFDLHIATLKTGELVFCSTRTPIERAVEWAATDIEDFYKVEGDTHYMVKPKNNSDLHCPVYELISLGRMTFGGRSYGNSRSAPNSTVINGSHTTYHNSCATTIDTSAQCASCYHINSLSDKNHLYCIPCYAKFRNAFLGKEPKGTPIVSPMQEQTHQNLDDDDNFGGMNGYNYVS